MSISNRAGASAIKDLHNERYFRIRSKLHGAFGSAVWKKIPKFVRLQITVSVFVERLNYPTEGRVGYIRWLSRQKYCGNLYCFVTGCSKTEKDYCLRAPIH